MPAKVRPHVALHGYSRRGEKLRNGSTWYEAISPLAHDSSTPKLRLLRAVDPENDHVRGAWSDEAVFVVGYQDFLCPYCRRLRPVMRQLREVLGDRMVYVFRHFPNEQANTGANLAARASEAAALQGRFFEMHDAIFDHELPIGRTELLHLAKAIGLDPRRFESDLDSEAVRARSSATSRTVARTG